MRLCELRGSLAPSCPVGGPQRWILTSSLWGSLSLAKYNNQMLFHARKKKNLIPFTPSVAKTLFLSDSQTKPLKPCSLEIQMP